MLWWPLLLALATAGLVALRGHLDKAHAALVYLLVVLGASARRGRRTGLLIAVLAFLAFNFFLLPPYYTFVIADPLDWLVLAVFLATGAVAAQLLDRAQRQASLAQRRAEEVERLSALGAETLSAPRATDAVDAIARVIRTTLGIDQCEIYAYDPTGGILRAAGVGVLEGSDQDFLQLLPYAAEHGIVATRRVDGTAQVGGTVGQGLGDALALHPDANDMVYPLRTHGITRGLLRLANRDGLRLDSARRRFAEALGVLCRARRGSDASGARG